MSEATANRRSKKLRRVVVSSVILLALLVAGGLALSVYARIRDVVDRVH
jgi:ABC-type Mn2+/Zn2+ transport system permease subunit